MRSWLNLRTVGLWSILLISRARKKGIKKNLEQPYPEPALVPLGEKPKVCEFKLAKGIRQISPVPSA